MKIYVVKDSNGGIVGAFTDENMADHMADICDEDGDASYNGNSPIPLELDAECPLVSGQRRYEVEVERDGRVVKCDWQPPLHRDSDGKIVYLVGENEFRGFTDDYGSSPVRAMLTLVCDEDAEYGAVEKRAKRIAARIVAENLWPPENDQNLTRTINDRCMVL